MIDGMKKMNSKVAGEAKNMAKAAVPNIPKISLPNIPSMGVGTNTPSLDVGTNMVKNDGLAMLRQGEAVVPKKYNPENGGAGQAINGGDTYYVTIDAKNVKEFNDVVGMAKGLKVAYKTV